ncbi:MAG: glycine/sarcosine/betaine reductase selenoprotein B family protein [Longimicrobiales bacterium]|nr:glycine/sarcosine/betaine reductase selenoprotein B family protein [Longimicrobiales bacterium]
MTGGEARAHGGGVGGQTGDAAPPVDGYRFLDGGARRVMRAWERREPAPEGIPWTPLARPLAEARVALISSAGVARTDDRPFDQEGERANPWWGDPTHRVLPRETRTDQIRVHHLHIDPRPGEADLDVLLPLRRLDELVREGVVGASADEHYSVMGYILEPTTLLAETAPALARGLAAQQVDLALLVPV